MALIEIQTLVNADIKICFDLARNIDFHKTSLKHTGEIAFAGKTTGLIEKGEWVSWEGKHFGFVQHLTSKITAFDAPNYFVDEMILGIFKSFRHEHLFQKKENMLIFVQFQKVKNIFSISRIMFSSGLSIPKSVSRNDL